MLLTDDEAAGLKSWVVRRLEDISDADPDILADYAIALVRAEAPEASLRHNTLEQLRDFLGPIAEQFVSELFNEINKRARNQNALHTVARPQPAILPPPSALHSSPPISDYIHPSRSGHISVGPSAESTPSNQAKKRTWQDAQDPLERLDIPTGPRRPTKQTRRAGTQSTSHVSSSNNGFNRLHPLSYPNGGTLNISLAPGQASQIDANMALQAMMAMQAQLFGLPAPSGDGLSDLRPKCQDYFEKGRCDRGFACLYSHQSDEYDPNNPAGSVPSVSLPAPSFQDGNTHGRGAARGSRNNRAPFSVSGPDHSQSNETIVVEQIPEENFEEQQVRDFFSKFGPIEDVNMQPYKRLAIVRFDTHEAAQAAWESPKVVFENRFVKVYWYDANTLPQPKSKPIGNVRSIISEPEFDRAKFEEENAEAQRKYEARLRAREDAANQSRELEEKRAALAEEQRELKAKLRERGVEVESDVEITTNGKNQHHDTDALKAQLAALEEEARGMGIDPDAMDDDSSEYTNSHAPQGRGVYRGYHSGGGYYRGRGGLRGRGNTWSARGAARARGRGRSDGPFRGAIQGNGRYNLDLRPRRMKIILQDSGSSWDDGKDECLREHLFGIGEFESVEPAHEDDDSLSTDSVVVVFKDRATAEVLFFGPRYIQGLGKINLAWIPNPSNLAQPITTFNVEEGEEDENSDDTIMSNAPADRTSGSAPGRAPHHGLDEDDLDVAEEDERWEVT